MGGKKNNNRALLYLESYKNKGKRTFQRGGRQNENSIATQSSLRK